MWRLKRLQSVLSLVLVSLLLYIVLFDNDGGHHSVSLDHSFEYVSRQPRDSQTMEPQTYDAAFSPRLRERTCTNKQCHGNLQRLTSLQQGCSLIDDTIYNFYLDRNVIKQHFIRINQTQLSLVYCDIPKIGSTFVKQVFAIISGFARTNDPFKVIDETVHNLPFKTFNKLDFAHIVRILDRSFKFFIVREPYGRLLSAYVDKLYTTNQAFWETVGKAVIKNTRKGGVIKCGHDVTFAEFVRHVIITEKSGNQRNPHWYPSYYACRPCHIKYDFIGKLETFSSDMKYLLQLSNISSKVNLTSMDKGNDDEAIALTIRRAFSVIKKGSNCISLFESLRRAWKVLQIRGILHHDAPFSLNSTEMKSVSETMFRSSIEQARITYPVTKQDKKRMKIETLTKAYASVPLQDIEEYRRLFHPDFSLYEYDLNPIFIKNREVAKKNEWHPFF